jgi:hypothetical protein
MEAGSSHMLQMEEGERDERKHGGGVLNVALVEINYDTLIVVRECVYVHTRRKRESVSMPRFGASLHPRWRAFCGLGRVTVSAAVWDAVLSGAPTT